MEHPPRPGKSWAPAQPFPDAINGWTLSSGCRLKTMNSGSVAETDGPRLAIG
jgi:hypothetical protein